MCSFGRRPKLCGGYSRSRSLAEPWLAETGPKLISTGDHKLFTLEWLASYLSNCSQFIKIGHHSSASTNCSSGVPQGSVLGPLLFAAYVSPVGGVISDHAVKFHQYADDTQLFLSMSINNCTVGWATLASCTTALKLWYLQNDLQLNANKSDVILLGTPPRLRAAADNDINSITVAGRELPVSSEFKSLGVLLDQQLSFQKYTTTVAKVCNYHIQAI